MTDLAQKCAPERSPRGFLTSLVAVLLLVHFFVAALVLVSLHQSRQQYVERAAVQAQNLSQALVYSIAGVMDTLDVSLLSIGDEVQRGGLDGGTDTASMNAFIARQRVRLPAVESMRVANAEGEILYGTGVLPGLRKSIADRRYFRQLASDPKAGVVVSEPMIGRISDRWVVIVARRVNNRDGSFGGVVYGAITLERIQGILSALDVGPNGGITLRDRELGRMVHRFSDKTAADNIGAKPLSREFLRRFAAGAQSGTFYSDSTARLISYSKVGRYPLYISVALSPADYLAPWRRDLARISALVALFVLVTSFLSRLVFLRWRREKEAQEALASSKEELERRVAERTDELFAANALLQRELAERERAEEGLGRGHRMLEQIINTIPQSVFWKDRDSVYLGCNAVFARAAGFEHPSQLVGKTDYDLPWPVEESDAYRRDDRLAMERGEATYHIVEPLQQADGAKLWIDTTKIPLRGDKGEIYGVLGVYENITERKAVEESRNKALALIESLLASSPTGIVVFEGESGDCAMVNRSFSEMVGGSMAELRAQNFRRIPSWRGSGMYEISEEVLATSVTHHVEKSITTMFGKKAELDCFFSRFDVDGKPHLMLIAVDISERKRLERENRLIEAQMLHVQKLESLGILAGGIAHDFNNILMVVMGNVDLALSRVEPDSPARENLVQIEHATLRAAELARQMLAYSGKGRFVIEDLDLTRIVEEMAQMLEISISKKVVLSYDFAKGLPAMSGDATQLRQVILNLVINASEAIGDNSGVVTIKTGRLECDRAYLSEVWIDEGVSEGSYLLLEVSDTGCGIDAELMPRIFDPFFSTKFTGRGLGMAAVLGIVRGHKGAIKIKSEKGIGTTFRLLFPALPQTGTRQEAVPVEEPLWRGNGTILFVDDEESVRALGEDMLYEMGFRVLTASNGRDGVETFRRNGEEIVCVLLDLTMPEMDGAQTLREMRRIDPKVKVIISSGYSEYEVSRKLEGEGITGFIEKPYKFADVRRKLQEILEQGRRES